MIEPNDILFPELDAAMASFPGFDTEGTFRGWLRNSVTKDNPLGDMIRRLVDDDNAWPIVYRLVSMRTRKLHVLTKGDCLVEITHTVEGEYSYGIGPATLTGYIEGNIDEALAVIGVLVQIEGFIRSNSTSTEATDDDLINSVPSDDETEQSAATDDGMPEPEPEEEPKPKTTRKKKVTTNEPSGDGGAAAAEDADAVRGETGDL